MVVAYFYPFFIATSSASLQWYLLHSTAIPPVILKTNGVNVACSTSNTRLPGVLALLLCFMLPEYLVWIHVSIGVSIRVANPNIKKSRPLPLPESPSYYIQPRIRGGVGSPIQLFSCDVLQNWLDFHVFTHHT